MTLNNKILISTVDTNKSVAIKNIFQPLGATIIDFPMIEITSTELSPSDRNIILKTDSFDWIIFTSAYGVSYFYSLLLEMNKKKKLSGSVKIAAIGQSTAKAVEKTDRSPDFIGTGATSEDLVNQLIEKGLINNKKVLIPLGNLAPDLIQEKLSTIASVTRINVYKTIPAKTTSTVVIDIITNNHYDMILFTSPSAIDNFVETMSKKRLTPELRIASIGIVTTAAAKKHGLECIITAKDSTYGGLSEAILNYYQKK